MPRLKKIPERPAAYINFIKNVNRTVSHRAERKLFFKVLVQELEKIVAFDRLCVNLYDSSTEVLSFFTTAEGTVVSALSALRYAGKQTVAGKVIESGQPVIIRDLPLSEGLEHPLAKAGLKTTIAYPLTSGEHILGTLHCSFREDPDDFHNILSFFDSMAPQISLWVDTILIRERLLQIESTGNIHPDLSAGEKNCIHPIFESPAMKPVIQKIQALAPVDIPLLLTGETGTGKTMLAQYIHNLSLRKKGAYVKVNCPALVSTLFESEFFGHKKGAFTGAATDSAGRVELARGGTLFLDEIGELAMDLQAKLLHVLEDRSFQRVGEGKNISTDFRLIAATNACLEQSILKETFRRDLYYRLATVIIEIPPLRERYEDIPLLVTHLNKQLSHELGIPPASFSRNIISILQHYHWPGNIRELRNIISRLLIKNISHKIDTRYVQKILGEKISDTNSVFPSLQEVEKKHIKRVLQHTNGTIAGQNGAANLLRIPRTTLQYRMKKYSIHAKEFVKKA